MTEGERKRVRNREYMRLKRAAMSEEEREVERSYARERMRRLRIDEPEKVREIKKRSYANRREHQIAKVVEWQRSNPERTRKKQRRWREEHRERHLEQARMYAMTRRSRRAGVPGEHGVAEIKARFVFHGNRCVYCGATEGLTIDHMIPLARGGSNWPANLVPACDTCNKRKHTKTYWEFIAA